MHAVAVLDMDTSLMSILFPIHIGYGKKKWVHVGHRVSYFLLLFLFLNIPSPCCGHDGQLSPFWVNSTNITSFWVKIKNAIKPNYDSNKNSFFLLYFEH